MQFAHLHESRVSRSYAPSFFDGDFISAEHAQCEDLVAEIRGKLERADHLKLYEAGYFALGPILEVGRLHAKSTALLALGARAAGHGHCVTSIELEKRYFKVARENLARLGVLRQVTLLQGDSSSLVAELEGPFDTVFVDGDHTHDGVRKGVSALRGKVQTGGVIMFHDYYHGANISGDYGVRRAVDEARAAFPLAFRGAIWRHSPIRGKVAA